jgi:V8-like Glu-specific endopeptidase
MAIINETNFTAEAQQRLAALRVNLEETKSALLQGNILTINSDVLPRRVTRLISNPLLKDALAAQPSSGSENSSVLEEIDSYVHMPPTASKAEANERLQQLSPQARGQLEAIIGGNDLLPIWFLNRGAELRRTVARIKVVTSDGAEGYGTGFLVGPGILITNRHVLDQSDIGGDSLLSIVASAVAEFDVEILPQETAPGKTRLVSSTPAVFRLAPQTLLLTDAWNALDYVLIALEPKSLDGQHDISEYGYNRLSADKGKTVTGEPVFIIQHPNGESKKISLLNNRMMIRNEQSSYLYYEADTEPGSSGSPVFNRQWEVVALHHSVEFARDPEDRILAKDGSLWSDAMGTAAIQNMSFNEGVRVSRILEQVETKRETALQDAQVNSSLEIISDGGMRLLDKVLATAHQAPVEELMQPLNQKITFASLASNTDFPAPE